MAGGYLLGRPTAAGGFRGGRLRRLAATTPLAQPDAFGHLGTCLRVGRCDHRKVGRETEDAPIIDGGHTMSRRKVALHLLLAIAAYETDQMIGGNRPAHRDRRCKSVFEKGDGHRLSIVATEAMTMRASATRVSCS